MSSLRPGTCGELGPYNAHCTDSPGHQYSHYDGGEDTSWQDDWRSWTHINGGGYDEDEDD
jgi:hypothetical protein